MKPGFYSSKEEIRNRILKNAENFWNIKDSNDFDPLIKLIIDALSNELFNVTNDVRNLENRIFDKISRILAPDHLTSALPAHAIIQASPLENEELISLHTQFSFKKNIQSQEDDKTKNKKTDIFFSPLHQVKLLKGAVKYVATGSLIHKIEQNQRTPLAGNFASATLEKNTVYIGLNGIKDWMELDKLNFFFDWKNYAVPDNTYDLLALGKWFYQDNPVSAHTERFMDDHSASKVNAPFHHKQLLNLIKADVLHFYSNRFITLADLNDVVSTGSEKWPADFNQVFQPATLQQLENVLWLKLVLPASITQEMLNELHITINAFPVVNKKLHQIKHRLKTMNNVIPIKTEDLEHMLAVESLRDNKGKSYNEIPYTNENEKGDGSFSIRYGGTERFDTRNAKELMDYLFELLRDEKAAFSAYGPDFLSTTLKNLEQNIALIEQKSRSALRAVKELPSYIILKPLDDADIVFLDIWVTQAEEANKINAGNKLAAYNNPKLNAESIQFLTQTKGGRSKLTATNRVQAYKYGLTTADRLITRADIISFCKYELADKIVGVTLAKGLILDNKPNSGFIKTTDIIIEPAPFSGLSTESWNELLDLTLSKIKLRSTMNIHFRMMLKTPGYSFA
ncbi:hypothetical protein [Pedobacter frigidisoli]|uniref:hypothetical protein n=1 Tax=Pedobacter frigidisoli TaxID=2530455 RepID=UPI0029302DC2|nr:hypothetical protein [Pedobacter frigidisoli]